MKKYAPLMVAAGLTFAFVSCSKKATMPGWSPDSTVMVSSNISVGALHSGMTVREVIAELGEPTRKNSAGLEFSGAGIFLSPAIGEMTFFPPFTGRTKEGIGIGSSRAEIVTAYGPPSDAKITKAGFELLSYRDLGLKFQVHDDRVDWMDVMAKP